MWSVKNNSLNPNPITKFFVVGLLGLTVVHSIHPILEWALIFIISIMYLINGFRKEAIKNILLFGVLFLAPNFKILAQLPFLIKMFFSLIFVLRMFYIPYAAGNFLIKTSDVGSIISSMDALKIPSAISIPVAVMFRFFPSFVEEKNNIKMAMKVRGIETKNPLKYLEYVAVPLLIISSNIADDISKSAETKCIANPIKKTRYIRVGVGVIDFIYAMTMIIIVIGGWLCLK
ncbi:energy-coupling factor transporter transmembrane component T family protein [Streptococcus agalactiae]|uniref:energy-coupling factor transporter transmembrane component T family protein n=1 Tax=Streptococcus agalactiae TaxID=1311 RepID=UPI000A33E505|nr:energy-coupling factor transporter transmembrane component T [Streptococcus agalactiae]OTG47025.1 ABC transporter permease [Streptococcus agalactiae]OTG48064.1 ABC transporter permease [Streptococcus agalactiae]OTG53198.1 ABC transporter permease [Streptococcus agalactiae]RRA84018.1 energy-coupling factor transporter transmembrane protein EcfT [Streptococcus agalactiae]RRA86226.1 energy-coupling factor transporter transmembrane protein EcfT [Streptococcus agalactiae]